jgi:hypothetical protein
MMVHCSWWRPGSPTTLADRFTGRNDGLDGHPVVETALVELYRQTGASRYLELAAAPGHRRGQVRRPHGTRALTLQRCYVRGLVSGALKGLAKGPQAGVIGA